MPEKVVVLDTRTVNCAESLRAAQVLAVTGLPVVGAPAALAPKFADPNGMIQLLAVTPSGIAVGVAVWESPGPSRRIPSARLLAVAVRRETEQVEEIVDFLLRCVPIQFGAAVSALGKSGGYVVVDLPLTSPTCRWFRAGGWQPLPPARDAATGWYVYFLDKDDE